MKSQLLYYQTPWLQFDDFVLTKLNMRCCTQPFMRAHEAACRAALNPFCANCYVYSKYPAEAMVELHSESESCEAVVSEDVSSESASEIASNSGPLCSKM